MNQAFSAAIVVGVDTHKLTKERASLRSSVASSASLCAKFSAISAGCPRPLAQRKSLLDLYRSINVFIERLWRSLKYECVYLHAFETGSELRAGLSRWICYYNTQRPHSTLVGRTPDEAYGAGEMERVAA